MERREWAVFLCSHCFPSPSVGNLFSGTEFQYSKEQDVLFHERDQKRMLCLQGRMEPEKGLQELREDKGAFRLGPVSRTFSKAATWGLSRFLGLAATLGFQHAAPPPGSSLGFPFLIWFQATAQLPDLQFFLPHLKIAKLRCHESSSPGPSLRAMRSPLEGAQPAEGPCEGSTC